MKIQLSHAPLPSSGQWSMQKHLVKWAASSQPETGVLMLTNCTLKNKVEWCYWTHFGSTSAINQSLLVMIWSIKEYEGQP